MICKSCMKNVASIKFTEVVDGKAVQHHLCPDCYKAYQEQEPGFTLSVPKPTVNHFGRRASDAPKSGKRIAKCAVCNTELSEVLESAKVGCASCFSTFGKEIESILEGLHGGMVHRGKMFKCDDERLQMSQDIQARRVLLRRMLKEEKYEEAARLRDEIAHMEALAQAPTTTG